MLGREEKVSAMRLTAVQYAILAIFLVLGYGLWRLQVSHSDSYITQAENNRVRKVPLLAPRGKIVDREGRLIVDNRRLVTVDLDRLRDRVAAACERLAAANADNRRLYEALEPVVGSYCPGLARTPYHIHRYGARLE